MCDKHLAQNQMKCELVSVFVRAVDLICLRDCPRASALAIH
jgi:hypothetical protein